MNRWIPYALAGALILLLGGLAAYRQAVRPAARNPRPPPRPTTSRCALIMQSRSGRKRSGGSSVS